MVLEWLKVNQPDIVLLQELKCIDEAFPYIEIEELGYNVAINGQKTYNGVAILSKYPAEDIIKKLPGDDNDHEARYIEGVISFKNKIIRVASIYVPNGQSPDSYKFQYKLAFLDRLYEHFEEILGYEEILVLGGDYNVAPESIDVFDPKYLENSVCFHPKERAKLRAILNLGLIDAFRSLNPNSHEFTWWDYRGAGFERNLGLRIDHLLVSSQTSQILESCKIDKEARNQPKASDHAPIFLSLVI